MSKNRSRVFIKRHCQKVLPADGIPWDPARADYDKTTIATSNTAESQFITDGTSFAAFAPASRLDVIDVITCRGPNGQVSSLRELGLQQGVVVAITEKADTSRFDAIPVQWCYCYRKDAMQLDYNLRSGKA
jgi:hypothetical protein